ncbi:MAG: hypothetical protein H0X25_18090, partial [Acidobacteriales bacterium]|nr:hypothetical protein [Terriglobales bacterium]
MQRKTAALALLLILVAALAALGNFWGVLQLSASALSVLRWLAISVLTAYALLRRKLTPWIVVGMFMG